MDAEGCESSFLGARRSWRLKSQGVSLLSYVRDNPIPGTIERRFPLRTLNPIPGSDRRAGLFIKKPHS